jgi:hypothetical protein
MWLALVMSQVVSKSYIDDFLLPRGLLAPNFLGKFLHVPTKEFLQAHSIILCMLKKICEEIHRLLT